jgi:hypothetical protein
MPLALPPPINEVQQPAVGIYGLPIGASAGPMVLLTATQIRAIAEITAPDLSAYLPLTGGTLTGSLGFYGGAMTITQPGAGVVAIQRNSGLVDLRGGTSHIIRLTAGGTQIYGTTEFYDNPIFRANLVVQNGTTPTRIQITNTHTSPTSFGVLDIRANAAQTAYEISSFRGSAGGTNLPINIGHRDSGGTFTSALSISTAGMISCGDVESTGYFLSSGSQGLVWFTGTLSARLKNGLRLGSSTPILYASSIESNDTIDTGMVRSYSGAMEINNGTAGTFRDLVLRDITLVPSASRTLATNGQFSIEMTSNTAGNLVYRGSDGTTRRSALVFV